MTKFETEPCGRCGGSGTHSYCQMWGTTCFDCGTKPGVPGSGRRLTKRGRVARDYFLSLLPTKAAAELIPGDKLRDRHYGTMTVTEIRPASGWSSSTVNGVTVRRDASTGCLDVITDRVLYGTVEPTHRFEIEPTPAERTAALETALAYEKTLIKTGKVAKRTRRAPRLDLDLDCAILKVEGLRPPGRAIWRSE